MVLRRVENLPLPESGLDLGLGLKPPLCAHAAADGNLETQAVKSPPQVLTSSALPSSGHPSPLLFRSQRRIHYDDVTSNQAHNSIRTKGQPTQRLPFAAQDSLVRPLTPDPGLDVGSKAYTPSDLTWQLLQASGSRAKATTIPSTSAQSEPRTRSGDSKPRFGMASTDELFAFSKTPLGDFERCMAFVESHTSLDYRAAADKMLWQALKTFERLHKRDFDSRHMRTVQRFGEQCIQCYALLDFGAECGVENLKKYLHNLVLTPEWHRTDYLKRMLSLPPPNRLEFIQRSVPSYLEKLKWFCLLYDHLYEKIEAEARVRMEKTLFDRFATKLEDVQARISRSAGSALNLSSALGQGQTLERRSGESVDSPRSGRSGEHGFIGRAL